MQTVTFDSKKINLMELVMAIDSENVLDKILDFVRQKMSDPASLSNTKSYGMDGEETSTLSMLNDKLFYETGIFIDVNVLLGHDECPCTRDKERGGIG